MGLFTKTKPPQAPPDGPATSERFNSLFANVPADGDRGSMTETVSNPLDKVRHLAAHRQRPIDGFPLSPAPIPGPRAGTMGTFAPGVKIPLWRHVRSRSRDIRGLLGSRGSHVTPGGKIACGLACLGPIRRERPFKVCVR